MTRPCQHHDGAGRQCMAESVPGDICCEEHAMGDRKLPDDWAWWAGSRSDQFEVGPLPTKDDAVQEALHQDCFEEVETPDGWRRLVYFAECCGLHYECDECGVVPEACQECKDYLYPEETAGTFAGSRNFGSEMHDYDD